MAGKILYITGESGGHGEQSHHGQAGGGKAITEQNLFGFCFPSIKRVRGENDFSVYVVEMTQCHF